MKLSKNLLALLLGLLLVLAVVVRAEDSEDDDDLEDFSSSTTPGSPPKPVAVPERSFASLFLMGDINFSKLKLKPTDFVQEILIVGIVGLYAVFYYRGQGSNKENVKNWIILTKDLWDKNFAHVGDNEGHKVFKDSPCDYIFYASGRVHLKYMYGFLKFVPRHDLISTITNLFFSSDNYDKVTFNIALNNAESDDFVFAILPKHKVKDLTTERWDLETFSKLREPANFPNKHYAILTDAPEFATAIANEPRIMKAIWASIGLNEKGEGKVLVRPLIDSIEITDMPKRKPSSVKEIEKAPKVFTITLALPKLANLSAEETQRLLTVHELVLDFVDAVGQFGRLTMDGHTKLKKLRQAATELVAKEEEKAKKETDPAKRKAEAKKQREEELAKLSPEARRKAQERDEKKEQKKLKSKNMKKGRVVFQ